MIICIHPQQTEHGVSQSLHRLLSTFRLSLSPPPHLFYLTNRQVPNVADGRSKHGRFTSNFHFQNTDKKSVITLRHKQIRLSSREKDIFNVNRL